MKTKVSFNLQGGGITGAYFHFGALAALDDHLSKKTVDYDVMVGTSAGSLVATMCALGMRPQFAVETILKETKTPFDITRRDIYRFSPTDISFEVLKILWTLFYVTYLKLQNYQDAPSYFWGMKDSLPAGLFSMRYYEKWIRRILESNQLPVFFNQIQRDLMIPAYNIDSCERTIFSRHTTPHLPFQKAISASSCIPIFFQPVEIEGQHFIDGGFGDNCHLDLSAAAGAELIIIVSPMVPIRNDNELVKIPTVFDEKGRIRDKGFTYIYDQSMRSEIRARVHQAIRYMGYHYPNVDILLIEPDDTDTTMFLFNPMDFESRKQIVQFGYDLTRKKLKAQSELWGKTLDKHGITLVGV